MSEPDLLRVEMEGGKYTIIQRADGSGEVLRYGETWITPLCNMQGSKMVLGMAYQIESLRAERDWWRDALREASGEQAWPGIEACVLKSFELSHHKAPSLSPED